MIYIATDEHGKGVRHVMLFYNRLDFLNYADDVLATNARNYMIRRRASSIDTICEALYDNGIGFGARHHFRVSRKDAKKHLANGANVTY
tara:strand:+ start:379 stop:645 length:267 start_codon:yes stop_codon:yes gene_type:complete